MQHISVLLCVWMMAYDDVIDALALVLCTLALYDHFLIALRSTSAAARNSSSSYYEYRSIYLQVSHIHKLCDGGWYKRRDAIERKTPRPHFNEFYIMISSTIMMMVMLMMYQYVNWTVYRIYRNTRSIGTISRLWHSQRAVCTVIHATDHMHILHNVNRLREPQECGGIMPVYWE